MCTLLPVLNKYTVFKGIKLLKSITLWTGKDVHKVYSRLQAGDACLVLMRLCIQSPAPRRGGGEKEREREKETVGM
jgi:hypothetical protein